MRRGESDKEGLGQKGAYQVGKMVLSISSKMRTRHRCGPEQGRNWRGAEDDIHGCGPTSIEGVRSCGVG